MKPGPRRSISQVDIVDSAFEILEHKGVAAVSVRGVAAALGLTPTAIYTYFPSKNALLRAMVEQLLGELDLAAASDSELPWADRVRALAAELRARLAEHMGAMVLVTSGPLDGPHALALNETLIAGFMNAADVAGERMPLADAARAAHAVRAYVLGAAALDAAARAGRGEEPADGTEPPAPGPTAAELWTDAAGFPLSQAAAQLAREAATGGADTGFVWGLDRLLAGLGGPGAAG